VPDYDPELVSQVKRRATERLLAIPGVTLVAIGGKETSGVPTGELVIQVYVRTKRLRAEIPADELIPEEIEGIKTDVLIGGDFVPLADPGPPGAPIAGPSTDGKTYRPLQGGVRIVPARGSEAGTMGCLMWDPANHDVGYGLTCNHVIDIPNIRPVTAGSTMVGQPSGISSFTECCDDIIGVYAGGEGGKGHDARDEALVRLAAGMTWKAEIAEIGVVAGTHDINESDVLNNLPVRKRGERTGLTGGVILSLQGSSATHPIRDCLVIRPNDHPDHDPDDPVFFCAAGDSGSVVMTNDNKVAGLVFYRAKTRKEKAQETGAPQPPLPPGTSELVLTLAFPITTVVERFAQLEQIKVEVATASAPDQIHTVPGGSTVPVPPELAARIMAEPAERASFQGSRDAARGMRAPVGRPWFTDVRPPDEAIAAMRRDLEASETGRLLISTWLEHQHELTRLVGTDRRATLAWQRGGGAAVFQLLLRMIARPDLELPETVNGQPIARCIDRLCATLIVRGSPTLGAALARLRTALPDLAGRTMPEIMIALDRVSEQGVGDG